MKKPVAVALLAIAAMATLVYLYFGTPSGGQNLPRPRIAEPTAEEQQLMMECGADPDTNDAACDKWIDMRVQRELGALWAQPRDPDWAEPMERRLRRQLVQPLEKYPVEISAIHCKTTVCRITAHGKTPESRASFIKAAETILDGRSLRKRLHFKASLSGDSHGDEWTHEFTLVRH